MPLPTQFLTAIIQLTYPDGWVNFHLYWAAMALAILIFGPGAISLDRPLGLDGGAPCRKAVPDLVREHGQRRHRNPPDLFAKSWRCFQAAKAARLLDRSRA